MSGAPPLDTAALAAFLGVPGPLAAAPVAGGKSNLTYRIDDPTGPRWVLRRPPTAGLTPSAHDMGREFRTVAALRDTGVPVARAVALCEDPAVLGAPFSVVEYVDARVVRTRDQLEGWDDRAVAGCAHALVRVLAALHAVDHRATGLAGRPEGYLRRQVDLWGRQWARVRTGDLPDLDRLHAALAASVPESSSHAVVHGDYRIDNVMLDHRDPARVRAVVDWELSTLGDPLADAAMMCVYRAPGLDLVLGEPAAWNSERLPDGAALARMYAAASGRELEHWGFHLGLAHLKLAVIAQGIEYRSRQGAAGAGRDRAGEAVGPYAAAGLRALATGGHGV
ncbi:Predicted kinase, aminoglycoside phosphotransferase (APT) family [Nocardiopsis flavescens]|uniref:Predicted kinase, aminoglycoside phosphotransferase (APT) family n=1 Tax=Nocardiopsis flavescens TaxID=758803 RepID=A0A1M6JPB4_9ACTN|nr:phosphotransferase family protein [Nocardiopsis flavescens]SHJ48488.1 Predicted kinase, aminoglycoside phosphotransferase (APT) family [Nocardiopsis flavescens]